MGAISTSIKHNLYVCSLFCTPGTDSSFHFAQAIIIIVNSFSGFLLITLSLFGILWCSIKAKTKLANQNKQDGSSLDSQTRGNEREPGLVDG